LVQQIGRIIRNPERKKDQKSYVFTDPVHRQKAFWEGYRKYEEKFESNPELYEFRQIFDTFIRIQPEYQYLEGNYRKILAIESQRNLYEHLRYPLSVNVYEIGESFTVDKLKEEIEKEWFAKDLDIRKIERPDPDTCVFIYLVCRNSPLLFDLVLLEYKLGFTIFHLNGGYLFFYDTEGNFCKWLVENAKRVDPKKLQSLFKSKDSRITEISLMNMNLGRYSIRRRTLHAHSIEDTAPSLVDYAHFVSTCRGYTEAEENRRTHRYIGFTRARISDHSSFRYEYKTYINWLESLASVLNSNRRKILPLFGRYASFTTPPTDPTPVNILIDLDEVLDTFEPSDTSKNKKRKLIYEDLCYDINPLGKGKGEFTFKANSQEYKVNISYDKERKIYKLASPNLEIAYVRRDNNDRIRDNLVGYLNRTQSFRIIPKTPGIIYAHSRFYKPNLPIYGAKTKFDLLNIIHPIKELADIRSEKGKKCDLSGWEKGCLFYLIDKLGNGTELKEYFGDINILICDDMGAELADFIAVDTKELKVIFIHAKAFKETRKRSATAFHEICSQAVKNLEILHPLSTRKLSNLKKWEEPWKSSIGTVKNRIRICKGVSKNSTDIWEKMREIVRNPSSRKEVWILLGSGFSLKAFKNEIEKNRPSAETVQIIYLLQSTWSAVSSVGALLKIFCSP